MATPLTTAYTPWIDDAACDLDAFRAQVARRTDLADYPHAVAVRDNVLVYPTAEPADRRALQAELIRALTDGPGVVVFEKAFPTAPVPRSSPSFPNSARRAPRQATTSESPVPTTASGTPRRNSRCTPPACSPSTTPTTRSP
jgi:hypothetical protein